MATPLAWRLWERRHGRPQRCGHRLVCGWRCRFDHALAPWRGNNEVQAAGPALIVVPFRRLSGGEGGQLLEDGLTNGLIVNLMRFDGLQVFAVPANGNGGMPLPSAADEAAAYVVTGNVRRGPDWSPQRWPIQRRAGSFGAMAMIRL